jgi:hypothetical protein
MNKVHRKYAIRGLLGGLLILWIGLICVIFFMAYQFDGQCGGWPFLSSSQKCSLIEFLVTDVVYLVPIAIIVHSPWILIFLFLATSIGYGVGRLKTRNTQSEHANSAGTKSGTAD